MRSEPVTFRIEEEDLRELRVEAEREGISLNNLIQQIISSHNGWQKHAARLGFITFHKSLLQDLVEDVKETQLEKIAVKSAEAYYGAFLTMRGKSSLKEYLFFLKQRAEASNFCYKDFVEEGRQRIVIRHDAGYKWSVLLAEREKKVFEKMGWKAKIHAYESFIEIQLAQPI